MQDFYHLDPYPIPLPDHITSLLTTEREAQFLRLQPTVFSFFWPSNKATLPFSLHDYISMIILFGSGIQKAKILATFMQGDHKNGIYIVPVEILTLTSTTETILLVTQR